MIQPIYRLFIELTNGRLTSSTLKKFSQSRLSKPLIKSYARVFDINKEEMKYPLNSYNSLHELFIRNLKEDARPYCEKATTVISPVDAVIEQAGKISKTKHITVKEKEYSLVEMFNDDSSLDKYLGGTYMIFYLSPRDYHRIHSPISGKVVKNWTVGKKSYPVNKYGLKYGKQPLAKNYRTITEVEHDLGHLAIVKVGAMFVNSIVTTYEDANLKKGKEIAYFSFGSTVVLFFERNTFELDNSIKQGMKIQVGEKIGQIVMNDI